MSRVANENDIAADQLTTIYAPVQQELVQVEELLHRELRSDYPDVDELVRYGVRLGGKRLRPALLLLSGRACGELVEAHVTLSAVVEMIHTATLVHDDILDEAVIRRHVDTVNARWNNEKSVLLGDFLFTHAFFLASTTGSTYACRTIGRSTNIVCEGELRQTGSSGNLELSEDEYYGIIQAKTAELCACCCQLGAHFADANTEVEEALGQFGRDLGVAFQIADDLLDLLGDEATTGKSLGTDLEKSKMTLPLIHFRSQATPAEFRNLFSQLTTSAEAGQNCEVQNNGQSINTHHALVLERLAESGSLDYARRRAEDFARQAADRLAVLPASPARDVLAQICRFVVARQQ